MALIGRGPLSDVGARAQDRQDAPGGPAATEGTSLSFVRNAPISPPQVLTEETGPEYSPPADVSRAAPNRVR